jgi:hypothetical protein
MITKPDIETRVEWVTYVMTSNGRWSWVGLTSEEDAAATALSINDSCNGRSVKVERHIITVIKDVALMLPGVDPE